MAVAILCEPLLICFVILNAEGVVVTDVLLQMKMEKWDLKIVGCFLIWRHANSVNGHVLSLSKGVLGGWN
jgi:hypothetical protein